MANAGDFGHGSDGHFGFADFEVFGFIGFGGEPREWLP
jgi:hypothetical protein